MENENLVIAGKWGRQAIRSRGAAEDVFLRIRDQKKTTTTTTPLPNLLSTPKWTTKETRNQNDCVTRFHWWSDKPEKGNSIWANNTEQIIQGTNDLTTPESQKKKKETKNHSNDDDFIPPENCDDLSIFSYCTHRRARLIVFIRTILFFLVGLNHPFSLILSHYISLSLARAHTLKLFHSLFPFLYLSLPDNISYMSRWWFGSPMKRILNRNSFISKVKMKKKD